MAAPGISARSVVVLLLAGVATSACGSSNRPPGPSPGGGAGGTITGRERIGWDQLAAGAAELATFRYAIYVDGARSEIAETSCSSAAAAAGFSCSGRLPAMSTGTHLLELATIAADGTESARSGSLRVTVAGATSSAGDSAASLTSGQRFTTKDGVELTVAPAADGISELADLALAPDGRLVIAERNGHVRIVQQAGLERPPSSVVVDTGAEILSVALSPDFANSGQFFVVHSQPGIVSVFRYRIAEGQLVERIRILPDVPSSLEPSAVLRFGPDAKLYAAFDDAGSRAVAERLSEWSGKLLRLSADGRTPDDQPAASPVFWSGLASPRGLDWAGDGGALWIAERGPDGIERIRALTTGDERPRRAGQRASYVIPGEPGLSALAFSRGNTLPQFRGDMFIAARNAGALLRVRFDGNDRTHAITTEKLFDGKLGSVRAVQVGEDGSIYCASADTVWRLTPSKTGGR
jgi:aldose sugar dehydrogenase